MANISNRNALSRTTQYSITFASLAIVGTITGCGGNELEINPIEDAAGVSDDDVLSADRDGRCEGAGQCPRGSDPVELARGVDVEDVSGADVQEDSDVGAGSSHDDDLVVDRDITAEKVIVLAVRCQQLSALHRGLWVGDVEDVGGPASLVVVEGADDGEVTMDGYGVAELVFRESVRCLQLGELLSRGGVEQIGGAGGGSVVVFGGSSDEDFVAADRDGPAEQVV